MARLIFVRHAPTGETGTILSGRLPGKGLTPRGKEMAASVANRLAEVKVDQVICSPIQRCRETAAAIAAKVGKRPKNDRAFIEVDYGDWTGRTLKSVRRTKLWEQVATTPSRVVFPGGEAVASVAARAVRGCERLAQGPSQTQVVIVSHGDIIKLVLSHYLGQPPDLFQRLFVGPASISVVDLPRDGAPMVPVINDTGHLERSE